jgi:hypothetical protein
MTFNIAKALEATIDISFEYEAKNGDVTGISVKVLEESLTPKTFSDIRGFEKEQDAMKLAETLSNIVRGWDIEYNGEPFPPTFENLSRCPFSFLLALVNAIGETWAGKKPTPTASQDMSAASVN